MERTSASWSMSPASMRAYRRSLVADRSSLSSEPVRHHPRDLILRSARRACLEGCPARCSILRDASLRDAPQDEVICDLSVPA
jgi:hypothetical protein